MAFRTVYQKLTRLLLVVVRPRSDPEYREHRTCSYRASELSDSCAGLQILKAYSASWRDISE